jgi:hypothetical protein
MTVEKLLWLVPVFFLLHNFEEALFMEKWSKQSPLKIFQFQSIKQFIVAISFLTVVGFLITYAGLQILEKPLGYLLVLEILVILLINAFFPHLILALRYQSYNPGLFTALIIIIPFSIYVFIVGYRESIVDTARLGWLLGLALFLMPVSIFTSLGIGKLIAR